MNFKSKEAYRKWLAYGHMHTKRGLLVNARKGRRDLFASTPGNQRIKIRGNIHKVTHLHRH